MALPHILVIDDSEAILVFMRAVLGASYQISTAQNGREGLDLCKQLRPHLVLLDLSMPEMSGEMVLDHLKADAELASIPVIVVSSEKTRAEACLARGAHACAIKAVRAEDITALVHRTLEAARARAARESMAVLPVEVGGVALAFPLDEVRQVILQPATKPLPGGPSYLVSFFEYLGEPICVLDLAARLGVEHDAPVVDRKLIVVEHEGVRMAVCVDHVGDPDEVPPADIRPLAREGAQVPPGSDVLGALVAVVKTTRGGLPVLRSHALLSRGVLRSLGDLLSEATG